MDVRSFILITGQELIAELDHVTGQGYVVKKPLVVHVMRGPDGQGQLAFAQWSMVSDEDTVEIYDHGLISKPTALLSAVKDSYIQQTSSLVLPPSTKSLILG